VQQSNAIRALKLKYREDIQREQDNEAVQDARVMATLFPMLEDVYEKAGILSCAAGINEESAVPLEGFDDLVKGQYVNQEQINECDAAPDTIGELRNKLAAQGRIADRIATEFDDFCETYPAELRNYIAANQHRAGVNQQQLEEFGPMWLQRHLEMTRKLSEEDKVLLDIEKELQDAEQAENVPDVIWEDQQREERNAR
jgi:hypothetical protein